MEKNVVIDELQGILDRMEFIKDAWQNMYTGAGIEGKDKKTSTRFGLHQAPIREELAMLFRLDGLTKKVINAPIKAMTKNWIYIDGDDEGVIVKKMRKLQTQSKVLDALRWQDVFGGAIIVMVTDETTQTENDQPGVRDPEPFKKPLNEETLRDIKKLKVYEKDEVTIAQVYAPTESIDKAGMPEIYSISPKTGGTPFNCHESRCLVFDGEEVPEDVRASNNGWGDSILTSIYDRLRGVSEGYSNLERIIEEFFRDVWKKPNVRATIGAGRKQVILDELNVLDMARHMINTNLIDDKESIERLSLTVTGLSELMTKLETSFAAVVDIPVSILFGDSPKGLNAAGSDSQQVENWYESLSARQEDELREPLERLAYLIMISKDGPTNGQIIEDWELEFNPLRTPSLSVTLDARKKQAEIDKIYWDMGVLTDAEIRSNRFEGDEYSYETYVEKDTLQTETELEPKEPEEPGVAEEE